MLIMHKRNYAMKTLTYIAAVVLVSASLTACNGNSNKTLGSTKDTIAKAGTGDPNNGMAKDSAKKDTQNKGNADPSGHGLTDTTNSRPVH
jgi:hypothetical protein